MNDLIAKLDLDTKARLVAGQDLWTLPAIPEIGLRSLVMSDGPVGVRGTRWSADDPSVTLPSPTALAATWDPGLAARAGGLLAQEARRKGVHVLLAPTVNLHRSPLGGRHFECYSEDPLLTGAIGAGYVSGVQAGGVGTTVKHFVANDSETERFTLDVRADERTLRELYLAPFERIVAEAKPWGIMAAYNGVNGFTMTEHDGLQNGILRGEWGFDGFIVSDWTAARHTAAAANGGLDVAMPGPVTVFGRKLADAVRAGEVAEEVLDAMVRRVLALAERVGALGEPNPARAEVDGDAIAREVARRSFVLLRNENQLLPLAAPSSVAVIGMAGDEARILGGGSATVFPAEVISPLEGLRAAAPEGVDVRYAVGADPRTTLRPASDGFELRIVARRGDGSELGAFPAERGTVQWLGQLPPGIAVTELAMVEIVGRFTPAVSGAHTFGFTGTGKLALTVGGQTVFDGMNVPDSTDLVTTILTIKEQRFDVELTEGEAVDVRLTFDAPEVPDDYEGLAWISFTLGHAAPSVSEEELIERAVALAAGSEIAVVVVATTEEVESEGFDRQSLVLPGRQDELVTRVAQANPRTVVVVNAGSPVEMPWTGEVAAVLLTWFPGQAAGAALADVVFGVEEPGGRLPTTWPSRMTDAPVLQVKPENGVLPYEEGVFIGYRAWERTGRAPAYWFGHGLGYTEWAYESVSLEPHEGELPTACVRVRNIGRRFGREVVQAYLKPDEPGAERPARWLAGFASVEAEAGEVVEVEIEIPRRAAEIWVDGWQLVPGGYAVEISHSLDDPRLNAAFEI
ncbi:glycoside hydrolase family 3 protein [Amycolatopsis sp. cg5]|uniref:beta-glucosidase n=1 Tax=Amycolatopsis sp. cg5 TaxID=3238802 RepID=UPI003524468A